MSWNRAIKPTKGILRDTLWVYGDIGNILPFYDYSGDYSQVPIAPPQPARPTEFQGIRVYMPELLEDVLNGASSMNNILLAAFNVNPQGGESGAYVCLMMDIDTYFKQDTECWARLRLRVVKRLYDYAGTSYTEHYPVGQTAQTNEFVFRSAIASYIGTDMVIFFKTAVYSGVPNYVIGWAHCLNDGYAYCQGTGMAYRIKESYFKSSNGWGADAEIPDSAEESEEYGVASKPKGGYNKDFTHGTFDDTSDTITLSDAPTFNAGMSGYFHAYFMSETDMLNLGKAIFPEPFISSQDIVQSMNNLITTFWNSKKIDCILDCLILPIAVPFNAKEDIKCGGSYLMYYDGATQRFIEGYPISSYYVDFSCGKLSLDEYWANFLDFTGTRIKIFIPAVGYVDLQTEYLNGGEIELKYRFNVVDGSFMAYIISTSGHSNLTDSVIAQYSGVWAMHIPLTAQDNSNKVSGLISAVGAVTAGAMTGGASVGLGAVSSLGNTAIQKPTTVHANGYNASSSFLTHRKPYVIIERQSSQFSEIYPSENGLPCYVAMPLRQVQGFTIIENPVLNIDCNDEEYNEICNLLKSGVIF